MFKKIEAVLDSLFFKGVLFLILLIALLGLFYGKNFLAPFVAILFVAITMLYLLIFLVRAYKAFKGFQNENFTKHN